MSGKVTFIWSNSYRQTCGVHHYGVHLLRKKNTHKLNFQIQGTLTNIPQIIA